MIKENDPKILEPLQGRALAFEQQSIDTDARTVEVAFSSETPVERWFGMEVLDHSPQSAKLDRLNDGAAVLVDHSGDQVGSVVSARIDADRVGRAVIRFSRSARGEDLFQDVVDRIRTKISVGYRILRYEIEERAGELDKIFAREWQPYEISLVGVPADATVGVGRSAENQTQKRINGDLPMSNEENTPVVEPVTETREAPKAPAFDKVGAMNELRTAETKRRKSIDILADKYDLAELGRQAITEGWEVPAFNEKALEAVGERNNKARAESRHNGEVDLSNGERKQFSLVRLMDAIRDPRDRKAQAAAGFELEVSVEATRGFGDDFKARGEFVPESLLTGNRALTAGTATAAAELVANDLLAGSFIETLRNSSAVTQAGMLVLPGLIGTVDIPRQTSGASSTWISAEDGDATESDPAFDQVALAPKDLACYTEVTRRLLQQSTPGIEGIVRADLASAQALGIDLAALYGTGANGQPKGVALQTGIGSVTFAAANPTYAEMIEMVGQPMASNARMGGASWIFAADGWEALSTTPKQGSGVEGNFILGDSGNVAGYGYNMSNQVTAGDYFFGFWSQLIMGEWGGLEVNVDPYTHSLKGRIRFVTFKTCDIAVRHAESFSLGNDTP